MTNPGRPVDDATIDTAWGLAVADTVVRRFPNAASRDADLANFTAADLLGQIVVLTDTGQIQQFAGPILGWQRPWGLSWGLYVRASSTFQIADIGSGTQNLVTTPVVSKPSGRNLRVMGRAVSQGYSPTWGASIYADGLCIANGNAAGTPTSMSSEINIVRGSTVSEAWILYAYGQGCSIRGDIPPGNEIAVHDAGPAAAPTALEVAGWENPTTGELVAGIVDDVDHAELLACSAGELAAALAELNVDAELYDW